MQGHLVEVGEGKTSVTEAKEVEVGDGETSETEATKSALRLPRPVVVRAIRRDDFRGSSTSTRDTPHWTRKQQTRLRCTYRSSVLNIEYWILVKLSYSAGSEAMVT